MVTRYMTNKFVTQTDFINQQTEKVIGEMQDLPGLEGLKALQTNIDKIEKEMGSRIEGIERDALKDLTPTLRLTSQKPYYTSPNQVSYTYAIENKGKYPVNISNMKLYLSGTKITSPENIANPFVLNKDYSLKSTTKTGDIAPGGESKNEVTIEFANPKKIPDVIYTCVTFDAQTDQNIVKSMKNIDSDKIKTKKFYYILGDIITPG